MSQQFTDNGFDYPEQPEDIKQNDEIIPAPESQIIKQVKETSYELSNKQKHPWWSQTIVCIFCFLIAVIGVYFLNTYVIRLVKVSGESMEPNLISGDILIVNLHCNPSQGDIVVFSYDNVELIKRVIAIEGQTVRIDYSTSAVYVDDRLLDEPYIDLSESGLLEEREETKWVVPDGCIFVMGDNRNHSNDSRNFGPIETDKIIGVKIARLPFGKLKK